MIRDDDDPLFSRRVRGRECPSVDYDIDEYRRIANVMDEKDREAFPTLLCQSLEDCLNRWKQRGEVADTVFRSALYRVTGLEHQRDKKDVSYNFVVATGELILCSRGFQHNSSDGTWYHRPPEG